MRLKLKKVLTVRNVIAIVVTGAVIGGLIAVREPGGSGPKKLVSTTDTSGSSDVVNSTEVVAANEMTITASQRYCYENWPVEIQYYKLVMNNGFCDLGFQPIPFERDCLIVAHTSMEWLWDLETEYAQLDNYPIVFKVSGPCSEVPKELLVPKNVQTTNLHMFGGLSTTSFVFPEGILSEVESAWLRGPDFDGHQSGTDYDGEQNFVSWDSFTDWDNLWTVNDKTFQLYGLAYTYECSWNLTCDAEYQGE